MGEYRLGGGSELGRWWGKERGISAGEDLQGFCQLGGREWEDAMKRPSFGTL